jgi:hypothetical protein
MEQAPTVECITHRLKEFLKQQEVPARDSWCEDTAARMLGLRDWSQPEAPSPRASALILEKALRDLDASLPFCRSQRANEFAYKTWWALNPTLPPESVQPISHVCFTERY